MIYKKFLIAAIGISISATLVSCAQTKKNIHAGNNARSADVILATSQKYVPGLPGETPVVNYKFVLKWHATAAPEAFFWRAQDGWQTCRISAATREPGNKDFPYREKPIALESIKKGDTLLITPLKNGKDAMPASIPASTTNTLFFKTGNTTWKPIPVNEIKQLPKVIGQ